MSKIKILLAALLLSSAGLVTCGSGASIEDMTWTLESYGEKGNLKTLIVNTEITAEFNSADSIIAGSAGCNNYFGGYAINNKELTIIPPVVSTRMACPELILDQERDYLSLLETIETFKIENDKLTISGAGNKVLVFAEK